MAAGHTASCAYASLGFQATDIQLVHLAKLHRQAVALPFFFLNQHRREGDPSCAEEKNITIKKRNSCSISTIRTVFYKLGEQRHEKEYMTYIFNGQHVLAMCGWCWNLPKCPVTLEKKFTSNRPTWVQVTQTQLHETGFVQTYIIQNLPNSSTTVHMLSLWKMWLGFYN